MSRTTKCRFVRSQFAWVLVIVAATASALAVADTTSDVNSASADAVQLGPVLRLADQEVGGTRLAVSPDGHAHVVLYGKGGISYVLVDATTVHPAESIAPTVAWPKNLAAALTGDGALHVVINEQHFTRTGEHWSEPVAGPPCVALTIAAGRLVCAMAVPGSSVNAPRRWTWLAYGGYGGAILFPWHMDSEKLVLLQSTEAGWSNPTAVDASTKYDAYTEDGLFSIAGDDSGVVHVVYVPYGAVMNIPNPHPYRYAHAKFAAQNSSPSPVSTSTTAGSTHQVDGVDSSELVLQLEGKNQKISIAIDPSTGDGLIVAQGQGVSKNLGLREGIDEIFHDLNHAFTVHDSTVSAAFSVAGDAFKLANNKAVMLSHSVPRVYLAPAGKGLYHVVVAWGTTGFHAKLTLYYLTYSSGTWSTPVPFGSSTVLQSQVQLGSAASNKLFVSWVDDGHKPVGRWIALP